MSRNSKTGTSTRGRHSKFAWLFGATATVCALLYWEQIAFLYVLSTLAMCGLFLVVAFSNLEAGDEELHASAAEETVNTRSVQPGCRPQMDI
ncbi:MAG TPA: hypothetical protein VK582_17340 [Pyrinomonadaceae bacterium]|nr:hypothetical protein [Pyrinomonadaceae bacterium]